MFLCHQGYSMYGYSVIVAALAVLTVVRSSELERTLINKLLSESDVNVRPVANVTDQLVVNTGFTMLQILGVDFERQTIEVTGFLKNSWHAETLRYDDKPKFADISLLHINPDRIWTPDNHIFNAVSNPAELLQAECVISPDGNVIWVKHVRVAFTCPMSDEEDKLSCTMKYGTWSYEHRSLSLKVMQDTIDATMYTSHHDWELFVTKAEAKSIEYPNFPGNLYDITEFSFVLTPIERNEPDDQLDNGVGIPTFTFSLGLLSMVYKLVF